MSHISGQTLCSVEQENTVQLSNDGVFGSLPHSGRVEICVCDPLYNSTCYWNTISAGSNSVPMSWKNCIVVCRQLGYTDAQSPILQNT